MSRAVGRHHAGAHASSSSPRRVASAAAPESRRAHREAGAHRSAPARGFSRVTLPTAAALTVSVVAAGAAGASTIDTSTTMSLGNHVSVAPSAAAAMGHTQPGADRGNLARKVSRSLPRPTATTPGVTPEAASIAMTAAAASAKKSAAKKIAARKAARTKAAKAAKKSVRTVPTKRTNGTTALVQKRVKTGQARSTGSSGWTCAIASCGGNFTSPFGARWGREHLGDDFSVPVGTPLRSLNSATVVAAGVYGGMGNRVELDFGNGITGVYAHMSSISVSVGQTLSAGDSIGLSGNTGNSTGPHLHLEIHINGTPIDPAPWLRAHGIF